MFYAEMAGGDCVEFYIVSGLAISAIRSVVICFLGFFRGKLSTCLPERTFLSDLFNLSKSKKQGTLA